MRLTRALAASAAAMILIAADAGVGAETWRFDRLERLGSERTHVEGGPRLTDTPAGRVVTFDGVDDVINVDRHPLAGARTFTFEAIFRPDGGAFAQRWFHLGERPTDAAGPPGYAGMARAPRIMFEIRVTGQNWYLDSFMTGRGYNHTLIDPAKLHPVGRWYHVAQTYDGTTYRAYVDGVLEGEAVMPFVPQGPGAASIGARINRVDYFKGAIYAARFSAQALQPAAFLQVPGRLRDDTKPKGETR